MAHPNDVQLSWDPAEDAGAGASGVAFYRVRRDGSANPLTVVAQVPHVEGVDRYTFTDIDRPVGVWHYRLTAVDAAGNESPFSEELVATVTTPPADLSAAESGTLGRSFTTWGSVSGSGVRLTALERVYHPVGVVQ